MLVKIEAQILIFPGTDFHFPSTSLPPGTFLKALGPIELGQPQFDGKSPKSHILAISRNPAMVTRYCKIIKHESRDWKTSQ